SLAKRKRGRERSLKRCMSLLEVTMPTAFTKGDTLARMLSQHSYRISSSACPSTIILWNTCACVVRSGACACRAVSEHTRGVIKKEKKVSKARHEAETNQDEVVGIVACEGREVDGHA